LTDPDCASGPEKASGPSLHSLIVDAGASFLQSHSDFQLFLKKVELSATNGIAPAELTTTLDNAIENMEMAHSLYADIYRLSLQVNFNPVILEKLAAFDYQAYQEKNQLNPVLFQQVTQLLKAGNLPGVYLKFQKDTGKILDGLKEIRQSLETTPSPQIPRCWRANHKYLEAALFGQYTSEVLLSLN
jgi:hypothetical protein